MPKISPSPLKFQAALHKIAEHRPSFPFKTSFPNKTKVNSCNSRIYNLEAKAFSYC